MKIKYIDLLLIYWIVYIVYLLDNLFIEQL
jgi:hypothetical protein